MNGELVAGLHEEVASIAADYSVDTSRAFGMWYAIAAFGLTPDEALDATALDWANDKSIDLFWVDDATNRVLVVQFKYSPTERAKQSPKDVDALAAAPSGLPVLTTQSVRGDRNSRPQRRSTARRLRLVPLFISITCAWAQETPTSRSRSGYT